MNLEEHVSRIPSIVDRPRFWDEVELGHHMLWKIGQAGDDLEGVVVLTKRQGDDGTKLYVELSANTGVALRHREALVSALERMAVALDCEAVAFESVRPEWRRVAPTLGFRHVGTVDRYEREVPHGRR